MCATAVSRCPKPPLTSNDGELRSNKSGPEAMKANWGMVIDIRRNALRLLRPTCSNFDGEGW